MFTLKKKTRVILFIAFFAVIAILIGLIVMEFMLPDIQWDNETLIKGTGSSKITYTVNLNDNPVFDERQRTLDQYYLKPFIDYIDINCDLALYMDQATNLAVVDQVDVFLISQVGTNEDVKVIWEKGKPFALPLKTEAMDQTIHSNRNIRLRFNDYDVLVASLIDDYELVTDYVLKVAYEATVTIDFDGIVQEEKFSSYIIIPFTNPIIEVTGVPESSRDVAIEQQIKHNAGPNMSLLILYAASILVCLGIILILRFKTKTLVREDAYSQKVADIFKEYGNRLAGLSETLFYQSSVMISIDKIEDMVKIADEIGQTVFYFQAEEEAERKIEFYVFDEGRIYYMVLFGSL